MKSIVVSVLSILFILCNPCYSGFLDSVRNMSPNSWYVVPNSDFTTQAGAIPITPGARGRFSSIIDAWCGGVLVDTVQRHYVWGGGHGDGSNNAFYYFDLADGEWKLYRDRDHDAIIDDGGNPNQEKRYPNGNPVARHTRGSLTHDPLTGTIYIGPAGSVWPGNHSDDGLYSLDDNGYTLLDEDFAQGNDWGLGRGGVTIYLNNMLYVLSVYGSGRFVEYVKGNG